MKVLFICKNNQFRSQMAMAIYNNLTNTNLASSAGTFVGAQENPENANIIQFFRTPDFFNLMEEKGMNIRNNKTKKLSPELLEQYDVVISMAEEPFIPKFLRDTKNVIWWDVHNPTLVTREVAEKTYEQIYTLVTHLITHNGVLKARLIKI